MTHIAFITYSDNPNFSQSDTLLARSLVAKGFTVSPVPWDKQADWKQYNMLILRSCWNYHEKYQQFLKWLYLIEQLKVPVWNSIDLVRWNSHKFYLADLKGKGIAIPPTEFVKKITPINIKQLCEQKKWEDIVIKPAIGVSAYKIARFKISELTKAQSYAKKLLETSDILIQQCLPEILSDGEYSLVFFGNTFSHAVNKKPKQGEFRSNYKFGVTETLMHLPKRIINQAKHALEIVANPTLYTRIDGCVRDDKFILMELELIEPHLFINHYLQGTELFSEELNRLNR